MGTTAVGYVRVSTEEQSREGVSLEAQRSKIEVYCELNDISLVEIIEDAGKSGKDLNREGIQSLINRIQRREIDAVVVYKLDRLSRRVKDTLSLMDLIEKKGVAFHSITERIDTKSAMGKFFLNIMASMNQWERDTISERTRDALHHKIEKNERAGQIPFGFTLGADGKTLIPEVSQQNVIRLVKRLHGQGLSHRAICRRLDEEGYPTIGGGKWHHTSIVNMLRRNGGKHRSEVATSRSHKISQASVQPR